MLSPGKIVIARCLLLFVLGAAVWAGSRPACTVCADEPLAFTLDDGRIVRAHQYVPAARGAERLPGVVVVHGFLGSSGFMEIPWAEDLARAGAVSLFVDTIGHGRTPGAWWPLPGNRGGGVAELDALHPEIHRAIGHLRKQSDVVEAGRIAILGHSDGGTGAIIAASADWDVAATVAMSASVAPWEYVNHVAPRNLLLVYGADDSFILHDTDRLLIENATRGYLDGEGMRGALSDGGARRLLRVRGRGHVDILYDDEARRSALSWLTEALALDAGDDAWGLSSLRTGWMISGIGALIALLSFWRGVPPPAGSAEGACSRLIKLVAVAALWSGALVSAGVVGPSLDFVPVREGRTVIGLLAGCIVVMTPLALIGGGITRGFSGTCGAVAAGAVAGIAVVLVVERVLSPMYSMVLTAQRLALSALFLPVAIVAFAATCGASTWVGNGSGQVARWVPVEWVLASIAAVLGWWVFVRMSILPVLLLALVLGVVGAFRIGGAGVAAAAGFGGVIYARLAGLVCAFY